MFETRIQVLQQNFNIPKRPENKFSKAIPQQISKHVSVQKNIKFILISWNNACTLFMLKNKSSDLDSSLNKSFQDEFINKIIYTVHQNENKTACKAQQ